MESKVVIVTGGNTGIGKAIAIELAKQKYHVVIVSRNLEKGKIAVSDITNLSKNNNVNFIVGDLRNIESTKNLANTILSQYPKISVLINNAGLWPTKLEINEDGLEMGFMVNHLAPFILSQMLLAQLKKNKPARIVNVNAGLYVKGKVDLAKTPYGQDFGKFSTYMNTKLCNIYFTQKFSEEIKDSGVTINAIHPGVVQTDLGKSEGLFGIILNLVKKTWLSPEEGAKPPVWLATNPEAENWNGKYFDLFSQKPYAKNANNAELKNQLWDLSKNLTSLK